MNPHNPDPSHKAKSQVDGSVLQEREAELLRAIADTLDCPIPPFVENSESEVQTKQSIK